MTISEFIQLLCIIIVALGLIWAVWYALSASSDDVAEACGDGDTVQCPRCKDKFSRSTGELAPPGATPISHITCDDCAVTMRQEWESDMAQIEKSLSGNPPHTPDSPSDGSAPTR